MRRIARWIVNGFVALSLLLCLAANVLWARSYSTCEVWWIQRYTPRDESSGFGDLLEERYEVDTAFGLIEFVIDQDTCFWGWAPRDGWHTLYVFERAEFNRVMNDRTSSLARRLGFSVYSSERKSPDARGRRELIVPLWFVAILAAAPAVLRLWHAKQLRTRKTQGLCSSCGYDLRATPNRCPECGKRTIAKESAMKKPTK